MVFSIVLWMPSWGGMINGLMTLNGAWDKLRTDPIIRMMVLALAFYGMATFEGPMMSIKRRQLRCPTIPTGPSVTSTAGALGWNGMITLRRSTSWCRVCGTASGSIRLRMVNWHFWLATIGIVLYAASMWVPASCRA